MQSVPALLDSRGIDRQVATAEVIACYARSTGLIEVEHVVQGLLEAVALPFMSTGFLVASPAIAILARDPALVLRRVS